jgi:hypothetical protein
MGGDVTPIDTFFVCVMCVIVLLEVQVIRMIWQIGRSPNN